MKKHSFLIMLIITTTVVQAGTNDNLVHDCSIDKYGVAEFLVQPKLKCGYKVGVSDVLSVIKILNTFWSWGTSNKDRYSLFSVSYKDELKKLHDVISGEQYKVPESDYERTWSGYTIDKIQVIDDSIIEIDMMLHWQQEGYSGLKSYIFSFSKIHDDWYISSIMY